MIGVGGEAVTYLGVTAGVLAVSLALYIQGVYRWAVPAVYTIGLYIFGTILVIMHLEPSWQTPEIVLIFQLAVYSVVILFELALFYDVHTHFSRFRSLLEKIAHEAEWDEIDNKKR